MKEDWTYQDTSYIAHKTKKSNGKTAHDCVKEKKEEETFRCRHSNAGNILTHIFCVVSARGHIAGRFTGGGCCFILCKKLWAWGSYKKNITQGNLFTVYFMYLMYVCVYVIHKFACSIIFC